VITITTNGTTFTLGDTVAAPVKVQCPRCDGSGKEIMFMALYTCEVCHGACHVTEDAARREIERRERERKRWL